MIKPENILTHEIVGLYAEIEDSPNSGLEGLCGKIVFESKNTITIKTLSGIKVVPKNVATKIKLQLPSGACFISGLRLIGRPEDRISRVMS